MSGSRADAERKKSGRRVEVEWKQIRNKAEQRELRMEVEWKQIRTTAEQRELRVELGWKYRAEAD